MPGEQLQEDVFGRYGRGIMTEFIMLVGIPASGKSTYAEKLRNDGYHVHSSDKIREELLGDENEQKDNQKVFEVLHKRIKKDLQDGISCVYDATNMTMRRRIAFLKEIKQYSCKKKCVVFAIPVEECKQRNANRERKVPDAVFDKMLRQFQCPYYYEGWNEIEVIGSEKPYEIPLDGIDNFKQDNPHHSLTLGQHMEKAKKYCIENYVFNGVPSSRNARSIDLIAPCYLHDIGKLYTKGFHNTKGEETKEAHYYGHENYGAYIVACHLFSTELVPDMRDGDLYTVCLINWHMRPYTAWKDSDKAKERDIALIGKEMYEDIMKLHEADKAAH